jgi:hypothetical protein
VIVGTAAVLSSGSPKYGGDRATIPGGRVSSPVHQ